jgi:hypothetical protein
MTSSRSVPNGAATFHRGFSSTTLAPAGRGCGSTRGRRPRRTPSRRTRRGGPATPASPPGSAAAPLPAAAGRRAANAGRRVRRRHDGVQDHGGERAAVGPVERVEAHPHRLGGTPKASSMLAPSSPAPAQHAGEGDGGRVGRPASRPQSGATAAAPAAAESLGRNGLLRGAGAAADLLRARRLLPGLAASSSRRRRASAAKRDCGNKTRKASISSGRPAPAAFPTGELGRRKGVGGCPVRLGRVLVDARQDSALDGPRPPPRPRRGRHAAAQARAAAAMIPVMALRIRASNLAPPTGRMRRGFGFPPAARGRGEARFVLPATSAPTDRARRLGQPPPRP